jgi:ERCC4-type nuclease
VTTDIDESADIESVDGVGPKTAEDLRAAGIETVGDLRTADRSDLYDIDGIGAATASRLLSVLDGADSGAATEEEGEEDDQQSADETADEDGRDEPTADEGSSTGSVGLLDIRNQTVEMAPELVGRDLDGVIEVTKRGDEWVSVVEMIERKSVPDTQDILGRYEIEFDEQGTLTGYRRVNRYRRTESNPDEF